LSQTCISFADIFNIYLLSEMDHDALEVFGQQQLHTACINKIRNVKCRIKLSAVQIWKVFSDTHQYVSTTYDHPFWFIIIFTSLRSNC